VYNEIIVKTMATPTKSEGETQPHTADEGKFEVTQLGSGILRSTLSPEEGLLVYVDMQKAQKGLIMANELHYLYLLTPVSLSFRVNWQLFHQIFKRLSAIEHGICERIGIQEDYIVNYSVQGRVTQESLQFNRDVILPSDSQSAEQQEQALKAFQEMNKELIIRQRHIRFYTTLILKDLLHDHPLDQIANFYGLTVGELQAFQQRCTVFVCLVTQFTKELQWWNLANLLNQYSDRINFVVQEELQELID
jgi:DNA polymerase theta